MGAYLRPRDLDDALAALAAGPRVVVVAGGTDFYPARVGRPLDDDVLDITAIAGLRAIMRTHGGWRIPALATWTDVIDAQLPPLFDGLKQAARAVGGIQIQNAGTVCGNLCNASPAADGVPNLLALDAQVELASRGGRRSVPVEAFVTGNRQTVRRPDELVTALLVPDAPEGTRSAFGKLGARRYLVISIAMIGATLTAAADGTVAQARIAVGACSAVAKRLRGLEAALTGRRITPDLDDLATADHLAELAPIDDVRGTAAYRRDATLTLLRRTLAALAEAPR